MGTITAPAEKDAHFFSSFLTLVSKDEDC